MTLITRRSALSGLATTLAAPALAQSEWPSRPVTIIVPQAAGGTNDLIARLLADKLTDLLGQRFVVDNRVGAGGNIGQAAASRAAPDGQTIMVTTSSSHVTNPGLYPNPGFDPLKDYAAISMLARLPLVLCVHPSFPAQTTAELIKLAKERPGFYSYGSAGNGTLNHLVAEMLKSRAGVDIKHIPYRGVAAMLADLVGGHIPIGTANLPSVISQLQGNAVRPLGVSTAQRAPIIPNVPPLADVLPGFDAELWVALFAVAGTPQPIITRLREATLRAIAMPDLREKFAQNGAEPITSTPEALQAKVAADLVSWAEIIRSSGARIE
ncbi:MAG: tripartite tricarboxylate transporter substrate binding protein [Alphaproteobacteria bacterium]